MQLGRKYFWPDLGRNIRSHTQTCEICLKNKYERHPILQEIGGTPIPRTVAEMLHMDIFFVENKKYLTCIDKFSRFLQIFHIRSNTGIPRLIEQILVIYPQCEDVTTDNESVFNSQIVNSIFESYGIRHHTTPIGHSITNGQVERVHSTILELSRSLAEQQNETITEVIYQAVREYNNTIHSVVNQKPSDVLYHSERYPNVSELLEKAQEQMLRLHNRERTNKVYRPGKTVYVKTDRRRKSEPRYKKHIVREENRNTIVTTRNKVIHKDNLRMHHTI